MTEQQVKIASKLYQCRDTAKSLYGDKYFATIAPHTQLIKAVMKENKIDEIAALLKISKMQSYLESGMNQMLFMASVVELIEPSKS